MWRPVQVRFSRLRPAYLGKVEHASAGPVGLCKHAAAGQSKVEYAAAGLGRIEQAAAVPGKVQQVLAVPGKGSVIRRPSGYLRVQ